MSSTTNNTHRDPTDEGSSTCPSRRPRRCLGQIGFALALTLGLMGATAGLQGTAQAEPTTSPPPAPLSETSKSHVLKGQLFVEHGVHLTLMPSTLGVSTYVTQELPSDANPDKTGQSWYDFEYYTDSWFRKTEIEYRYRVEGTNDEVWIKVTKRPLLDDITQMEVRDVRTDQAPFNPTVVIRHHGEALGLNNFDVRPRPRP